MLHFLRELPKAELHLHLEGSVEPETMLELDPSLSIDDVRSVYQYTDFTGFIRSYVWVARKLLAPKDYALITRCLLERLAAQHVAYAEINLSVGVILWKEQDFDGIFSAVRAEAARSSVDVRWIFDAVRQFGADPAMRVAELAVSKVRDGVVAFGIGGDEVKGPAGWFKDVFAFTRSHGLGATPHAGETDGPHSVWAALELGANRIGHGIRSIDDPVLLRHLRDNDIPLEVCISSNVCTGAITALKDHPVRRLYDAGVPIVLNTDDPAMFHTTLTKEYEIAATEFGFSEPELRGLAANAFRYRLDHEVKL
jgi:aminodeoxyfutalosine deaminase